MRILFVTHTGTWSGAESVLMNLIENLRSEHDVVIACPRRGAVAERMDRAGVPRFSIPAAETSFRLDPIATPLSLVSFAGAALALTAVVRRVRPDVIHAATVRAGLIAAPAARLGGPPVVVHVHDLLPTSRLGLLIRWIIARSAREVIAVSKHTAEDFNHGLRRPLAVPIYNGIDHARFDPDRVAPSPVRLELGIAPDALLLGSMAQITPWKGQDTAIRALAQLCADGRDVHLLIVGRVMFTGRSVAFDNPAFLRELHRLTAELGLNDRVHFLGFRDDAPGLLAALDLLLLPSWDEPFALVVLEGLAMGTPVVISDIGGAPEVIGPARVGRCVPPRRPDLWARAIAELDDDPNLLHEMRTRAPAVAARFRDDVQAQEIAAVYARSAG